MQKRKLGILFVILLTFISACTTKEEKLVKNSTENTTINKEDDTKEVLKNNEEDDIIDLTKLSDSMVYAELYVILTNPQEYLGRMISMKGEYFEYFNEVSDSYNFFVLTTDEDGCCQTGLEFVVDNDKIKYPEDYPKEKSTIEVTGIFTKGYDDESEYYYLLTDSIE